MLHMLLWFFCFVLFYPLITLLHVIKCVILGKVFFCLLHLPYNQIYVAITCHITSFTMVSSSCKLLMCLTACVMICMTSCVCVCVHVCVCCPTEPRWEESGFVPFISLPSTSSIYMLPGLDSLWWLAGLHRDSFN